MEDNQESLGGKQSPWHNDVKKQIFDLITVERIRVKAHRGWRLTPEDNEQSMRI